MTTLTDLRVRNLIDDKDYIARRRDLEIALAAVEDRRAALERGRNWIEPGQLVVSFNNRALSWFRFGSDNVKRLIAETVGSNYVLLDKKLSGEAVKPFMLRVEQPIALYRCGYVDDIRTRFEHGDPELLKLIEKVREIKAMVETEGLREAPLVPEAHARGSSRGLGVRDSAPSPRQRKAPPLTPPSSDA